MDFKIEDQEISNSQFETEDNIYKIEEAVEETSTLDDNSRKYSNVWDYFRPVNDGTSLYECIICNGHISKQTGNLARHLLTSHNIPRLESTVRTRRVRSFVWNYCFKENSKQARCLLCDKLLYFGGGNTANISKHLRRIHSDVIGREVKMENISYDDHSADTNVDEMDLCNFKTESIDSSSCAEYRPERKGRKGASYVWNYCVKLSRHTIRCKLCQKVMSFHGTANIITHLQRRHNIVGKMDKDNINKYDTDDQDASGIADNSSVVDILEDKDVAAKRGKRSAASSSIVWKYCTRISPDSVMCSFCKKVLSYQGTSNLQRHLHRMHGIVPQIKVLKNASGLEIKLRSINTDFIWEHCTQLDDDKVLCNMCNTVFESKDTAKITKHLTFDHAVDYRREGEKRFKFNDYDDDDDNYDTSDDNVDFSGWNQPSNTTDEELIPSTKTIELACEQENLESNEKEQIIEEPFDDEILQEIPIDNPLSAQTSRETTPEMEQIVVQNSRQINKRLQNLKQELLRVEAEYFREKAGYYRMQKYLIALQAKKARIELNRMNNDQSSSFFCGLDTNKSA